MKAAKTLNADFSVCSVAIAKSEARHASYPPLWMHVRIELGNTGSRHDHKYLKELEEEDGATAVQRTISEALQDLVDGLPRSSRPKRMRRYALPNLKPIPRRLQAELETLLDGGRLVSAIGKGRRCATT
jgi:hypothetical protein